MIVEYHRPETIEEALTLLARKTPHTVPLAGGTVVNQPSKREFAVVDLQALDLDRLEKRGNTLHLGATLTLQSFLEWLEAQEDGEIGVKPALQKSIEHEATYNLRQVGTIAGTLVAANGRSPFATAMLALDAELTLQPDGERISLGDLYPLRDERLRGRLITQVSVPLNSRLAYEYVARTPADQPIVCAALASWQSGRLRLSLGGYGDSPMMVLDGIDAGGVEAAARSAYLDAGDEWASAAYRSEIAAVLAQRCLRAVQAVDE